MCYRLGVFLELLLRHTRLLKQSEGQFAALAIGHHSHGVVHHHARLKLHIVIQHTECG